MHNQHVGTFSLKKIRTLQIRAKFLLTPVTSVYSPFLPGDSHYRVWCESFKNFHALEKHSNIHTRTCTQVFIAVFFIIAKFAILL